MSSNQNHDRNGYSVPDKMNHGLFIALDQMEKDPTSTRKTKEALDLFLEAFRIEGTGTQASFKSIQFQLDLFSAASSPPSSSYSSIFETSLAKLLNNKLILSSPPHLYISSLLILLEEFLSWNHLMTSAAAPSDISCDLIVKLCVAVLTHDEISQGSHLDTRTHANISSSSSVIAHRALWILGFIFQFPFSSQSAEVSSETVIATVLRILNNYTATHRSSGNRGGISSSSGGGGELITARYCVIVLCNIAIQTAKSTRLQEKLLLKMLNGILSLMHVIESGQGLSDDAAAVVDLSSSCLQAFMSVCVHLSAPAKMNVIAGATDGYAGGAVVDLLMIQLSDNLDNAAIVENVLGIIWSFALAYHSFTSTIAIGTTSIATPTTASSSTPVSRLVSDEEMPALVSTLLAAIQQHAYAGGQACINGLGAVAALSSATARTVLVDAGAVQVVVGLLLLHASGSADIAINGCLALASLCQSSSVTDAVLILVRAGGCKQVVDILNEHCANAAVVRACLPVLWIISVGNDHKAVLASVGSMEALVQLLGHHLSNTDIQMNILQYLYCLVDGSISRRISYFVTAASGRSDSFDGSSVTGWDSHRRHLRYLGAKANLSKYILENDGFRDEEGKQLCKRLQTLL